jgi:hypothetical protein
MVSGFILLGFVLLAAIVLGTVLQLFMRKRRPNMLA